jgi:hypothetical protein
MEFFTSVMGGKAPRDGAVLSIALGLQGGDALAQYLHTFHAARQRAPRKNTDLDLGPIQPTAVCGRVCSGTPLAAKPAWLLLVPGLHTQSGRIFRVCAVAWGGQKQALIDVLPALMYLALQIASSAANTRWARSML